MNTFPVCAWIAEINVKIIAQRGISAENEISRMFVDSCQRGIKSMLWLRVVFVRNTCEYVPFHFTVIKTAALTLASRSTSVSHSTWFYSYLMLKGLSSLDNVENWGRSLRTIYILTFYKIIAWYLFFATTVNDIQ